jgi:hypothetical protein
MILISKYLEAGYVELFGLLDAQLMAKIMDWSLEIFEIHSRL